MIPKTSNEPFVTYYDWQGETHHVPADVEGTLPKDARIMKRHQDKWFARLSAPGYLDCTDWQGPHETEKAALLELWFTFGGDDTFDEFIGET